MGWDVKKGGRKYYYQSQRVDGKTVKIYKGPGKKGGGRRASGSGTPSETTTRPTALGNQNTSD